MARFVMTCGAFLKAQRNRMQVNASMQTGFSVHAGAPVAVCCVGRGSVWMTGFPMGHAPSGNGNPLIKWSVTRS